jgi:hypothetical protein
MKSLRGLGWPVGSSPIEFFHSTGLAESLDSVAPRHRHPLRHVFLGVAVGAQRLPTSADPRDHTTSALR